MDPIYRIELIVSEEVVDRNRHLNNVTYVQWMQEAAIRHAETSGCTLLTSSVGATWVARHHHIEYLSPAFTGDVVTVLTWVSNMRKVRSLRKYQFVRAADDTLLAHGETDWVFVDANSGRPRAIPPEIQDRFVIVAPENEP